MDKVKCSINVYKDGKRIELPVEVDFLRVHHPIEDNGSYELTFVGHVDNETYKNLSQSLLISSKSENEILSKDKNVYQVMRDILVDTGWDDYESFAEDLYKTCPDDLNINDSRHVRTWVENFTEVNGFCDVNLEYAISAFQESFKSSLKKVGK